MTTFKNVYKFSVDVDEARHDGHEIAPGDEFVLDPAEPDALGRYCHCYECGTTFLAFTEEVCND